MAWTDTKTQGSKLTADEYNLLVAAIQGKAEADHTHVGITPHNEVIETQPDTWYNVNHNLNKFVSTTLYEDSTNEQVLADVKYVSENTIAVKTETSVVLRITCI